MRHTIREDAEMDENEVMEVAEPARKYTYEDYFNRDDDIRYELIDGVIYLMANPSLAHQTALSELHVQFYNFLKGKPCRVLFAPFGVRLNVNEGDNTVLEPDLFVVCDESKLDGYSCIGAPDLVVEILSPSTSKKDKTIKLNKYQQAGVRELWYVEPTDKTVTTCILKNGEYVIKGYDDTGMAPVHVLDGCIINLSEVFT